MAFPGFPGSPNTKCPNLKELFSLPLTIETKFQQIHERCPQKLVTRVFRKIFIPFDAAVKEPEMPFLQGMLVTNLIVFFSFF